MSLIHIAPVTKDNWEEAMNISVHEDQKEFVPSIVESLAFAYIKPWDEAFDPYTLFCEGQMVGFYYLSYTPGDFMKGQASQANKRKMNSVRSFTNCH